MDSTCFVALRALRFILFRKGDARMRIFHVFNVVMHYPKNVI